jgi:hypothetical protein
MRKWVVFMDVTLLVMALALLLIDLKIKEDIVTQAKALQGVIDGQGSQESARIPSDIPGGVLPSDHADNPPVAPEDTVPGDSEGDGRTTRNIPAKRRGGNSRTRIPAESERVGS